MSAASSLVLFLHPPPPPPPPPLLPRRHHYYTLSPLSLSFKSLKPPNTICFSSNSSHDAAEESRWLREEQRWLREEQRWLREEQRWARDRDALLREIAELKLKIQALERQGGLGGGASVVSESDTIASVAGLLQMLKEKNLIAETGSSSKPLELNHQEIQEIQEIQEKEVIAVSEVKQEEKKTRRRSRSALRKGLEGEEVRAMQEALLKLGFYSGEEDMEFSSFSTGTERAVKTWQASLDIPQDGIVTAELLELLFADPTIEVADDKRATTPKEDANGAAVTSATEITEVQQTVVKEEDGTEVEVSHHRVFLLGENRWEDSSRLITNKKKGGDGKTAGASTRCLTCRGEGRLLCTVFTCAECDGTGEPNIEEQFLDWVEEGAKCPYCEGLGYTICDVCDGKPVA
ncbi:protein disulfide isomerase pTAC5, chloroplastic isoform X2 [Pyrus x bretschneideri]|uniref:protein disulfide isomerase pTAC5, chloroplastic isoform X2 n=1 Tax=Pyrus x bretschneideri TaxID=225117 RepID=UPI0020303D2B|nr:protein disulfide isomerase pTAC5, chloroplastic isoform X2 [Pyrus x bretschneideri]